MKHAQTDILIPGVFDIRSYGAIGDGKALDTQAIQNTIDACSDAGGGRVYLPAGTYLCGSLMMKSHVELHLHVGATLLASPRRKDYIQRLQPSGDEPWREQHTRLYTCNLIHAADAEQIAITGLGTIDGQGRAFFYSHPRQGQNVKYIPGWRPGHMISMFRCIDITIRGVRLIDSPCYSVAMLSCRRIRITGITILNDRQGPNTDGIDPIGCKDVAISDCFIETGDDCIAPKSGHIFLTPPQPMEGLVVTNCVLSSPTCGVRIGYEGDGPIRNCTFSNLVINNTRTGINMLVPRLVSDGTERIAHGPTIENIVFQNLVMDTCVPIFCWIGGKASRPGAIRDVMISDIIASAQRGCYIGGTADVPIESIRLDNMQLNMHGTMNGGPDTRHVPDPYPVWDLWEYRGHVWPGTNTPYKGLPHALYARHVHGLDIKDMRINWTKASGTWLKDVQIDESSDVCLTNVRSISPHVALYD